MTVSGLLLAFSPRRHWIRFSALLVAFVLARGVIYLCVLPPMEGWDEYQHLAYIQHLVEHDEPPVLWQTRVPRSLVEKIAETPVPTSVTEHLPGTGAVDYDTFFRDGPPGYVPDHPDVELYQAQHGTLYYRLVRPVFLAAGGIDDLPRTVAALRGINLLLLAGALAGCLGIFGLLSTDRNQTAMIGVLIACHPLYLINGCRVANDGLALFLGTFVVLWAMQPLWQQKAGPALLAGCLLGLGIWAKSVNLVLVPFLVTCLAVSVFQKTLSLRRALVSGGVALGAAFLVALPGFFSNWEHFGMITAMQEAVINRAAGKGFTDLLAAAWEMNLPMHLIDLWWRESTWIGGQSTLGLPPIRDGMFVGLLVGLSGWLYYLFRRTSRQPLLFRDRCFSLRCALLVIWISGGLSWHLMHSYVSWHPWGPSTASWYACLSFPFALVLLYEGASRWARWLGFLFGGFMIGVFLFAEWFGIVQRMLPAYSGGAGGVEALQRLAGLQPAVLGLPTFFSAALLLLCLFTVIGFAWLQSMRDERSEISDV